MTPIAVEVTRHARRRIRERLGLPSRAVVRAAARALRDGVSEATCSRDLRRYIEAKTVHSPTRNADIMRVHAGVVFAFAQHGDIATLLTAWPLPGTVRQ